MATAWPLLWLLLMLPPAIHFAAHSAAHAHALRAPGIAYAFPRARSTGSLRTCRGLFLSALSAGPPATASVFCPYALLTGSLQTYRGRPKRGSWPPSACFLCIARGVGWSLSLTPPLGPYAAPVSIPIRNLSSAQSHSGAFPTLAACAAAMSPWVFLQSVHSTFSSRNSLGVFLGGG